MRGKCVKLKQNMLNKIKEEVHAKTLTNLGTGKEYVCVCEKNNLFFLINWE